MPEINRDPAQAPPNPPPSPALKFTPRRGPEGPKPLAPQAHRGGLAGGVKFGPLEMRPLAEGSEA